jgi:uncharacterized protein (TIGR02147 family)
MPESSQHETAAESLPAIFDYLDYRRFLADWLRAKQATSPAFSHRVFARRAGYRNPSLLGLIIRGKRNLSEGRLPGFARTLGLDADGRAYLQMLVRLDRAKTDDERNRLVAELTARRRFQGARHLEDEGFRYISHWYYPAIRELAGRADFQLDAHWVAGRLRPRITPAKAAKALDDLMEMGMLEATPDGGARQTESNVVTAHEVQGLAVRNYHKGMLELARRALDQVASEERHFGAVTVLAPSSLVPELKREIGAFQERIMELCDGSREEGEVVLQLDLQLFPLSERDKDLS